MSPVKKLLRTCLVLLVVVGIGAVAGCGPESKTKEKDTKATKADATQKAATDDKKGTEKPDAPKPDAPKPDAPKPDAPKPDAPKPDAPKPDVAKPQAAGGVKKSELLIVLPKETCNTPDGMCLLPDGSIVLSMPNFNDAKQPPLLMKITKDNKAEVFFKLPDNPDSGKPFGPLGMALAPNGDIFLADYQMTGDRKSRVVRIVIKDGKAVEAKPVVTGFHVSNGLAIRDGALYVTETQIDIKAKPGISGVMRFTLDELAGEKPVALAADELKDPHLVATLPINETELPLGADGICFDKAGNLYVSTFSDAIVYKIELGPDGKAKSTKEFAKADFMKSGDGMVFDPVTETIILADSRANAIQMISMDGKVTTLAQNGDTDGMDGGMDQPCEPLVRGREVIVSNMDWPVPGCINKKYHEPATLSVIKLDK